MDRASSDAQISGVVFGTFAPFWGGQRIKEGDAHLPNRLCKPRRASPSTRVNLGDYATLINAHYRTCPHGMTEHNREGAYANAVSALPSLCAPCTESGASLGCEQPYATSALLR